MTGTKRYYNRVQVLVYVLFAVLISGSLLHYLNLPDKTYGKHNSQHSNTIHNTQITFYSNQTVKI